MRLGLKARAFFFTWGSSLPDTVELFFRNARWLERECAEMFAVWYQKKRDRRSLFLVPLLYWGVLRLFFPVAGFFELRLDLSRGSVGLFHVSALD